ncbi:MAG: hypothetical protein IJP48_02000 [Synergistaceae bacterium]|nr:hypothetical protein [Synergistaceae bacterium]
MKRLFTLSAVLVLALSFAAFGAVQDFGRFTLDVPEGWTGTFQAPSAIITKNDNTAQLVVTISGTEGASLGDIAAGVAEAFKQQGFTNLTEPTADSDGDYSFEGVNPQGAKSHVLITGADDEFCMFTMTGLETAADEIQAIIGSLAEK